MEVSIDESVHEDHWRMVRGVPQHGYLWPKLQQRDRNTRQPQGITRGRLVPFLGVSCSRHLSQTQPRQRTPQTELPMNPYHSVTFWNNVNLSNGDSSTAKRLHCFREELKLFGTGALGVESSGDQSQIPCTVPLAWGIFSILWTYTLTYAYSLALSTVLQRFI